MSILLWLMQQILLPTVQNLPPFLPQHCSIERPNVAPRGRDGVGLCYRKPIKAGELQPVAQVVAPDAQHSSRGFLPSEKRCEA